MLVTVQSLKTTIDKNRHIPYNTCKEGIVYSTTPCIPWRGVAPQMARDEARYGKGFEGLLKRYFGK